MDGRELGIILGSCRSRLPFARSSGHYISLGRVGSLKPPRFDYVAPTALDAAFEILASSPDEAKILAGGQSLVPLLNMRLAMPGLLVDINRIEDAPGLSVNGSVSLGPLVRQAEVEKNVAVTEACPLLREAIQWVGHPQIRNRGTVLGSLAHGDPAAELPVVFVALDGEMTMARSGSSRTVAAREFFVHIMETTIQANEMLVEASVPALPEGTGSAFLEVGRRHGDFAVASVAVVLRIEAGEISQARVAMGGVSHVPVRATKAEERIVGDAPSEAAFAEAGRLAAAECEPPSDIHGTAEYRRDVIRSLVAGALALAAERSRRVGGDIDEPRHQSRRPFEEGNRVDRQRRASPGAGRFAAPLIRLYSR